MSDLWLGQLVGSFILALQVKLTFEWQLESYSAPCLPALF